MNSADFTDISKGDQTLQSHVDNFLVLEQQKMDTENYYFLKFFQQNYKRYLEKLRCYSQQKRLDSKQFMQFSIGFGFQFIEDIISFINKCDSNYCFQLIKEKQKEEHLKYQLQHEHPHSGPAQSPHFESSYPDFSKLDDEIQQQDLTQAPGHQREAQQSASFSVAAKQGLAANPRNQSASDQDALKNGGGGMEDEDLVSQNNVSTQENTSSQVSKKCRQKWSEQEIDIINAYMDQYYPNAIPMPVIQNLSNQFNRSFYSISSKIQKLKKQKSVTPQNASMQSNQSFDKKALYQNKQEQSLEKMIILIMKENPQKKMTKLELLQLMEQRFSSQSQDDTWKKSVSQLLSSRQSFLKTKGTIKLSSSAQSLSLSLQDLKSIKQKLVYVLSKLKNQQGTINQIIMSYMEIFLSEETLKKMNHKEKCALKQQISQVINQNDCFDKSNSKTLYSLQEEQPGLQDLFQNNESPDLSTQPHG